MVTDLGPKTTIISSSCYSPTCIKPIFFTRPTGLNFVFSKCITTPRLVSSISLHSRRRCGGRLTDAWITCILSRLSLSQFLRRSRQFQPTQSSTCAKQRTRKAHTAVSDSGLHIIGYFIRNRTYSPFL